MKKKILISVIILIVITGVTLGALILIRGLGQNKTNTDAETSAVPDRSANYGACDLVTVAQIKDALGESAAGLTTGFDTGKGLVNNGDTAQNCVYGFHDPISKISGTMLQDSFYTTIYVYADKAHQSAAKSAYDGAVPVDGIGDRAGFFTITNETAATTEYRLRVDAGGRSFSFAIRQTTSTKTFDPSTAINALRQLAKNVHYSDFADKK